MSTIPDEGLIERADRLASESSVVGFATVECDGVPRVSVEVVEDIVDRYIDLGTATLEALRISYPMTPVDALLSDLRGECAFGHTLDEEGLNVRIAEFESEVRRGT